MSEATIQEWLDGDYDEETKAEIRRLQQEDPDALADAFYRTLEFGTGGLRGLMGVGTNRLNVYTIRSATQGLATYLKHQVESPTVLVGYDSRLHSREFAEEAARVLAGNGIRVRIFKELRPTPLISFGCRHLKCSAAVMVTASHNPPEYNGYKVYWSHGGQVLPPHDVGIVEEVNRVKKVELAPIDSPLIEWLGDEVDHAYYEETRSLARYPQQNQEHGGDLKVVFSSLHGTGITLAPESMRQWGFTNVQLVEKQCIPDGHFPTIKNPNPEDPEAMTMGIDLLEKIDGDVLIATDGDADRVGIGVRHEGKTILLNGNQIACVLIAHLCEAGNFPEKPAFIKTIVTSELFRKIAEKHGCKCFDVLTGFKYIGQLMTKWEKERSYNYIFGGEESYGYLLGTHTRDKDGIAPSSLICEAALSAKLQGKTLIDKLHELYDTYGLYREELLSIGFKGMAGAERMKELMQELRDTPPTEFANVPVQAIDDYKTSIHTDLTTGKTSPIELPTSNVLVYWLQDGSRLVVRPSGTEPKIKLYAAVVEPAGGSIESADRRMDFLLSDLRQKLK